MRTSAAEFFWTATHGHAWCATSLMNPHSGAIRDGTQTRGPPQKAGSRRSLSDRPRNQVPLTTGILRRRRNLTSPLTLAGRFVAPAELPNAAPAEFQQ